MSNPRNQNVEIQDLPAGMETLPDGAAARVRGGDRPLDLTHEDGHASDDGSTWANALLYQLGFGYDGQNWVIR